MAKTDKIQQQQPEDACKIPFEESCWSFRQLLLAPGSVCSFHLAAPNVFVCKTKSAEKAHKSMDEESCEPESI